MGGSVSCFLDIPAGFQGCIMEAGIIKSHETSSKTTSHKTPDIAADVIIRYMGGIVLIKRRYPPHGWAIPGGHINVGETVEQAAIREAREETGLNVNLIRQFHVYSDPKRDPRKHTVSVVFIGEGKGELKAGDDAEDAKVFAEKETKDLDIAFDHTAILMDYFNNRY